MKAIILGADRGVRRLDSAKSYPVALLEDRRGKRALDWTLSALAEAGVNDIVFVGGYHIEKIVQGYSRLRFYYNPDWQTSNDTQTLACAIDELRDACIILRSSMVFRPEAVSSLLNAKSDVTFGVKVCTPEGEDSPLGENWAGIVTLSPRASSELRETVRDLPRTGTRQTVSDLVQILSGLGLSALCVDVSDSSAPLSAPNSLSRFVFGTKAQTLERLRPLVKQAAILDQIRFSVADWWRNSLTILDRITTAYPAGQLIIRSSAVSEDSWSQSQAGRFRSELGIDAGDRQAIQEAVESVIASFDAPDSEQGLDEVFVQPHLDNVSLSGVLFTRDLDTNAPYVVINYDDISQRTDTVTSGRGEDLRTAIVYKYSVPSTIGNPLIAHLMVVVSELEGLSGHDSLDVEFAFDRGGQCYVLQVRPLAGRGANLELVDSDVEDELVNLRDYVSELMMTHPHLGGDSTVLANMPDWNPAEIIGISPRPLAWSLYQHIITDRIWGEARAAIGYRDTYPEPLIVSLAGHPYVDTRTSFNSFIPASLAPELGDRLVDHYLAWLRNHPEFHDKIEFEVALTCLDFDYERQRGRLLQYGFASKEAEEIRLALLSLTNRIVEGRVAPIEQQMALVDRLAERRERALAAKRGSLLSIIRTVQFLLDDCVKFGTLPFSILARYAFVSTAILRSLRARGVFSSEELASVFQSMPTVATQISGDFRMIGAGNLTEDAFLTKYGHLRPGTYDIMSNSYAEAPEFYLGTLDGVAPIKHEEDTAESTEDIFLSRSSKIGELIRETGFTFDPTLLREFIFASIPAREKSKFEFTKNLSAVLSLLVEFGEHVGLSRDDMSFLPIRRLLDVATNSPSDILNTELSRAVTLYRKRHALHQAIKLPLILTSASEIGCFELLKCQPNYVTLKRVAGPVVDVNNTENPADLIGKIALIESADPGYDWVFSRGIRGLVTKYGGAASHMAIRAAELGLPAAIGCGEMIYSRVVNAKVVELDCTSQHVRVLRY